jgi:hypothetical protein
MRSKISRLITTGRYRHRSLAKEIRKTSKEIANLFERPLLVRRSSAQGNFGEEDGLQRQKNRQYAAGNDQSPFITDARLNNNNNYNNEFGD